MDIKNKTVTLRDVTAENVREICDLSVYEAQKKYVVTNARAIAEASCIDEEWVQAIYGGETPVGLAVLKIELDRRSYFLWRLMIDANYQNQDFGRQAIQLLIEQVRAKPNNGTFLTSVVPGDHSPQGFYERLGFRCSGEWRDGEAIMVLTL